MRIIFSRKGFDSAAGGCPSPLLDGCPISLPIPTRQPTKTTFGDLRYPVPEMVTDLTRGKLNRGHMCHVDPDIDESMLPDRPTGWRGAFGQVGKAQKHLSNQGVTHDDLFLFWGLFRPVEKLHGKWRYFSRPIHAIYGWLQVSDVVLNSGGGPLGKYPWLDRHPHVQEGWGDENVIYVANNTLNLARGNKLRGFGVFRKPYQLTALNRSRSPYGTCRSGYMSGRVESACLSIQQGDGFRSERLHNSCSCCGDVSGTLRNCW
jgi:hypothetical protein